MKALAFAWRSLVRQPARAALGILGVAAVGALLFDMLLLSDGLVTSMREMLERTGFDIRVTATGELPRGGRRIAQASAVTAAFAELPEVERALAIRFVDAVLVRPEHAGAPEDEASPDRVGLEAVGGDGPQPWTVLRGRDATALNEVVVNQALATDLGVKIGDRLPVRARCRSRSEILPPASLQVVGVAEFPLALDQHVLGSSTFSAAVSIGSRKKRWNTKPIERRRSRLRSRSDSAATSRPSNSSVPSDGVSTHPSMWSSVDLPQPDGPRTAR